MEEPKASELEMLNLLSSKEILNEEVMSEEAMSMEVMSGEAQESNSPCKLQ